MDKNHHILSGFKAMFSEQLMVNIDEARRVCGGAGYQSSAGFTSLYGLASPNVTLEGENKVMLGQATRYLVKLYRKVKQGKQVEFPFTYLNDVDESVQTCQAKSID